MSSQEQIDQLEKIIILDFGGPDNQTLTRRIREFGVYAELLPGDTKAGELTGKNIIGIILAPGDRSVQDAQATKVDPEIFQLGIPILGIAYGMHLMALELGGQVKTSSATRARKSTVTFESTKSVIFKGLNSKQQVFMAPGDAVVEVPQGFERTSSARFFTNATIEDYDRKFFGVQFHPEARETNYGTNMLKNFAFEVCQATGSWDMEVFANIEIERIKETVGDKKIILAISGGVDSSVTAVLLNKAVGSQLTCVFVDHGLLRQGEADMVMEKLRGQFDLNIVKVDAKDRYLSKLAGVEDPEQKRKIIGEEFIRIFEEEARKLDGIEFLAQGTIYSDVIESGKTGDKLVKSHHNVGGLPEDLQFELIEPLSALFKDEVRALGEELGMPAEFVWRQPFPGPGLGVRILGEVTEEKLEVVRESDAILREEISKAGLDREIWQYFTVLPGFKTVGVRDGKRSFEYTIGIRAIYSNDGMTADFAKIPWEVLSEISQKITDNIPAINRVVYDITAKPPATVEWE